MDCPGEGGYGQVYIGAFKHPRPSNQTDLKNGVDMILKAVENRRSEEELTCGAHWPVSL